MATNLVSPGISISEIDLSQVPQVTALMGPAFIGTTKSGPAFKPTIINNYTNEFVPLYGGIDDVNYVPYGVKYYLKYGSNAVVCRILGTDTTSQIKDSAFIIPASASWNDISKGASAVGNTGTYIPFAVLRKRSGNTTTDVTGVTASTNNNTLTWNITITGSGSGTYSVTPENIESMFTRDPINIPASPACTSLYLDNVYYTQGEENAADNGANHTSLNDLTYMAFSSNSNFVITDYDGESYTNAATPWIVGAPNSNGTVQQLFRFHALSDGDESNNDCKISLDNITRKLDSFGNPYFTFDVLVRSINDSDFAMKIYEKYSGCTLLTNDVNYIVRKIGDMNEYYNISTNRIDVEGTWPNKSNYIRIEMGDGIPTGARPSGFEGLDSACHTNITAYPYRNFRVNHVVGNMLYAKKPTYLGYNCSTLGYEGVMYGCAVNEKKTGKGFLLYDAGIWSTSAAEIAGVDVSSISSNFITVPMYSSIANYKAASTITATNSTVGGYNWRFTIPLMGGMNGYKKSLYGDDLITTLSANFINATDMLSNADLYDFNMLAIPGTNVNITAHQIIIENAIDMVETRGDVIYIADFFSVTADSPAEPTGFSNMDSYDSSYAATYWPWIKVYEQYSVPNGGYMWLPPSMIAVAQLAYNDKVAYPWYAPAGVNRGQIANAKATRYQLTQADRDTLYESRVNPIATFRNEGVVIWGQKTLQQTQSALDRVNVRRMLIYAKKLITRIGMKLLFEPNNQSTWKIFTGQVNPILQDIANKNGLEKFLVIMDSTTNTPDRIDRNEMYGKILVIPTKAVEELYIDFVIHRSGVEFNS